MVVTVARPALPKRQLRSPKHPFRLSQRPWTLQPFMCAPVLPGETMSNLLIQSRVVSDVLLDAIGGWWLEYWFFYVKLTDLDARDDLMEMLIDPDNANVSALRESAVNPAYYTSEGGINWPQLCLKRVVEEYFRNEGETWNTASLGGLPLVAIADQRDNWMHSLIMQDSLDAVDVSISTAGDNAFTMSELENARREYELLKMHGLQKMTWEDYLTAHGIRGAQAEEAHRPELLRHIREWQYPSNAIDPSSGVPRSAVSWAVSDRADKARFFPEPGFILGITCARPKSFYRNQNGLAAGFMQTAASWLPAMLQDDAWSSLTKHITTSDSGPLPGVTDAQGYVWDMRDLLLYGEQFVNFAQSAATGYSAPTLPDADLSREYVDQDDYDALWVSTSAARVRQDGVVHLHIKTRQAGVDTTPGSSPSAP